MWYSFVKPGSQIITPSTWNGVQVTVIIHIEQEQDRAEKRQRMRAVDSFWRVFDRLINESFPP